MLGDDGAGAGQRTTRGGIVVRAGDFNPERIFLDDLFTATPDVDVADRFPGAITGVMDYSFGNYKLQALALPSLQPAALPRRRPSPRRRTSWPWPPSTWRTSTRPIPPPASPASPP